MALGLELLALHAIELKSHGGHAEQSSRLFETTSLDSLHRPDGSYQPRTTPMKCQSRECFRPAGQPDKPRSIYCSRRCQSREQNLRQGRIKSTRRTDRRFPVERNKKFEGAAFPTSQSVFAERNASAAAIHPAPAAGPTALDHHALSPLQPASPPAYHQLPASLPFLDMAPSFDSSRAAEQQQLVHHIQQQQQHFDYPSARTILPPIRELIQRVTGEAY